MSQIYRELAERIVDEMPELNRLVQRVGQRWSFGKIASGQQPELWHQLRAELLATAEYLEALADAI
jgi:hypothetical protein